MTQATRVTEEAFYHGEGPVWYAGWGGLRFVDMLAGDVLALDHHTGAVARTHVGEVAAALRPRTGGGMVVGIERGFLLVDPDGTRHDLGELWTDPGVRMNDGGCDPQGRFFCGSMAKDQAPGAGTLYRLDPDGTVGVVLTDVTVSNGLAFTADGDTAYYVDSATQRVDVLDFDGTRVANRRPLAEIPREAGTPDGLTIDAEGYVWVALHGGGAVRRYAPDGRLDGEVRVPAQLTTACALSDDGVLYVTTSQENMAHPGPEDGALYAAEVGVAGGPVYPFAG